MIENNISRSFVSGLRGAEQAQRLANPAGWLRQGVEKISARSSSYVAAAPVTADGDTAVRASLHDRSVNAVAWARDCKVSKLISSVMDSAVGSGVHAPQEHSVLSRDAWRKDNLAPQAHNDCVDSLKARFDHILANPTSVGVLGLAVGIAQLVPATLGGAAGTAVGATLGGVADLLSKGGNTLLRRESTSNYMSAGASWGAYFGAGAANLAAATILPFTVSVPALAVGLFVFAPNLALQGFRAANAGIRAAAMGTAYVGTAACLLGADAARGVGRQLNKLSMPAFLHRSAAHTTSAPAQSETELRENARLERQSNLSPASV